MSQITSYKTVATISEGLYKEKMSKFISFAIPVFTVDEAMALFEEYRNKYHDARHVCWGYRVGASGEFT
ncbi:MAG: YigZ family protein, partial [Coprobacter sp.]|nr:YigZ family protein [Coprobacter sp.]